VCPNATLQQQLANMLSKALTWQLTRMNSNGSANLTGNTRVTGDNKTDEKGRGGQFKGFDYGLTINAFQMGSILLQNVTLRNEAQLIAEYVGWLHGENMEEMTDFSIDEIKPNRKNKG
jgi:hypothetical protein